METNDSPFVEITDAKGLCRSLVPNAGLAESVVYTEEDNAAAVRDGVGSRLSAELRSFASSSVWTLDIV